MASKTIKTTSTCDLFNAQIDELKQMKIDLEQLKNELTMAQTKYHQRLSEYEAKFEQLHLQAEKIQQEQDEKETNLLNTTAEWLDIKTKLESSVISPKQKVKLNVGGRYFETTIETLTKHSKGTTSYFKALFSRQWQLEKDPKDESIFIDRDGDLFNYILQYLRTDQLIIDDKDLRLQRNLTIEAEFYKIEILISSVKISNTMPQNHNREQEKLYLDTKILSNEQQKHLNKLYGKNNQRWQLLYRANRDGFTAKLFHKFCDGQGPTMTVIKSQNGFIFGGFTTVPWSSTTTDKADSSAFLFTLKNCCGLQPTKYSILERSVQLAVSHKINNGPTFGSINNGGSDIYLKSPFNADGSRIFFPNTYQDTTGKGRFTFTCDSHFSCDDVEAFLLIKN
jgi:hypothetical protein